MNVLISFLFLGFCFFGLGSSEKIKPDIKMTNATTYHVTCRSVKATQEISNCLLEKRRENNAEKFDTKRIWGKSTERIPTGRESDQYSEMVTNTNLVGKACQATLTSNAEDHMGMSL